MTRLDAHSKEIYRTEPPHLVTLGIYFNRQARKFRDSVKLTGDALNEAIEHRWRDSNRAKLVNAASKGMFGTIAALEVVRLCTSEQHPQPGNLWIIFGLAATASLVTHAVRFKADAEAAALEDRRTLNSRAAPL